MLFGGVKVFNPRRPRIFYKFGGVVKQSPRMSKSQIGNDSVLAILQPNEIVIPVKHAKMVTKMLKQKNIKLPNL